MIEIDVTETDARTKQRIEQFKHIDRILGDLLSDDLVQEARKIAPASHRTRINRRRVGKDWRVFARSDEGQSAIETAVRDFDWRKALYRLLRHLA